MGKITAAITGVGQYLPEYILTNDELSRMVDTNDEWIMSHTGIKTRHILKGEGIGIPTWAPVRSSICWIRRGWTPWRSTW